MSRVVWLLVAVSLAAGCRGRLVGHFGDRAFYHVRDHYRIRYAPGAGGAPGFGMAATGSGSTGGAGWAGARSPPGAEPPAPPPRGTPAGTRCGRFG